MSLINVSNLTFSYEGSYDNIFENIEINNKSVYVFDNSIDKNYFENNYKKDLFLQNPIFMNFNEFKEKVDEVAKYIIFNLRDHIFKENYILYPTTVESIKEYKKSGLMDH